jgi:hypothetical protein
MKKIIFTVGGRRFEVELDDNFAQYVSQDLSANNIALDRNNDATKLLQLYLKALKKNHNMDEQIKTFMVEKLQ